MSFKVLTNPTAECLTCSRPCAALRHSRRAPTRVRAPCSRRRGLGVTAAVEVAAAPQGTAPLEALRFLTPADCEAVRTQFGTPAYVYDLATLKRQVRAGATRAVCVTLTALVLVFTGSSGAELPQRVRTDRQLRHEV